MSPCVQREALPHFLTHLLSGTQGVSALEVMSDITPCLILWCGLRYVPSPHIHMGPSAPLDVKDLIKNKELPS